VGRVVCRRPVELCGIRIHQVVATDVVPRLGVGVAVSAAIVPNVGLGERGIAMRGGVGVLRGHVRLAAGGQRGRYGCGQEG